MLDGGRCGQLGEESELGELRQGWEQGWRDRTWNPAVRHRQTL